MQRDVQNGLHTLHVGLCHLPWLTFCDVTVADACQVHCLFQSIAELELFEHLFHVLLDILELVDGLTVNVEQFATLRHHAIEVFLRQLQCSVNEVAIDGHQFRVVALLEVLPHEVVVLCLGCVGCKHIAQYILLAGEVNEIFVQPYCPVARCRNLVVLEVEELVCRHVVGHDISTVRLHHHGEDETVEHDIVFSYEVYESGVLVLPPLLPCAPALGIALAQFFGVRDIADGRIEPYVQHLSVGTFHRNGDAPVEVACHGAWLQVHVEPRLALSINIGAPLFMTFENPFLQPVLPLVQRQIPVLCLLQHWLRAADGALRVDEFGRREVASALLALVAVCPFVMAIGTLAGDVAVGEELLCLLVIILLGGFFHQFAVVVEFAEEVGCKLMVCLACGAAVNVERDAELLERVFDHLVIAVNHILRCDALFAGTHCHGHSMLVRAADEYHFLFLQSEIAHVDVGRHIHASQVSDVHSAVGVWQCRCDQCALKVFLLFHCFDYIWAQRYKIFSF